MNHYPKNSIIRKFVQVTYSELANLMSSKLLVQGIRYLIIDFATVEYVDGEVVTGSTEPIVVQAISSSAITYLAFSTTHPEDVIWYDWNPDNWLADERYALGGVIIPGFKGAITMRQESADGLTAGLESVSANAPLTGDGTSGSPLAMPAASDSQDGYLTKEDWVAFNALVEESPAGPYYEPLTDITYAELATAIGESSLVPGAKYRITDFQTVHYIVDADQLRYDDIITGTLEPLIVAAIAADAIGPDARSENYPQDVIHYDWNPDNWLNDYSFATGGDTIIDGFKGVITFRHDTLLDNYCSYDFRNVKSRRWKTGCDEWDGETAYEAGDYVQDGSYVYRALIDIPAPQLQIETVTLTGSSGTANVTDAGDLTKLVTFNSDLPTTAADFVTAWAADYLVKNIVVTSNNADLIFTSNILGTGFTAPVVANVTGDLGGTVVHTQANIPIVELFSGAYWIQQLDLSFFEYWNASPNSMNGIPSAEEYADFKLFVEGSGNARYEVKCCCNHFESTPDNYYGDWGINTRLNNNVIFLDDQPGFYCSYNQTGGGFAYNTIASNFFDNTIGNYFSRNTVGKYFYVNTVGNYFYGNTVGNYFNCNNIGTLFNGNHIGNDFDYNTTGTYFNNNTVGNDVSNNNIGSNFFDSTFGSVCHGITFGPNCHDMTFGPACFDMMFDAECFNNTFGSGCYGITFGPYCYDMTFGADCYDMVFGAECSGMTFGAACYSNTFGPYCYDMTFGPQCYGIIFGPQCYEMTFGDECYAITFGPYNWTFTFGAACGLINIASNVVNIVFGAGCGPIDIGSWSSNLTFGSACQCMYFAANLAMTFGDAAQYNTFESGFVGATYPNRMHFEAIEQIETITLSGSSGTAIVTVAGGLTKTATFRTDLDTTAADFVASHAAAYDAEGIVVTSATGGKIVFTAKVAGTPFSAPVITNDTGDLTGSVDHTQANNVAATHVYAAYNCRLFIGNAGGKKLEYYDEGGSAWVVVAANA